MKTVKIPVIVMHITGWLLFQGLPLVFLLGNTETTLWGVISHYQYWLFCLYFIAVFYIHGFVLLPKLLHRKKRVLYGLCMAALLASVIWLTPFERLMNVTRRFFFTERMVPPNERGAAFNANASFGKGQQPFFRDSMLRPFNGRPSFNGPQQGMGRGPGMMHKRRGIIDLISLVLFIMIISLSVAMDITRRWRSTMERASKAEADKANAELSFLKAQINPHFLFNTLNNIYSMSVTGNEHTSGMIMKLSNIMRYVTDDVNDDFVSLQSEVDCISDYIDLQKLRTGKKVTLDFSVSGDLGHKKIAPLVLMTFIENVFKYGTSNHAESHLVIRLEATDNHIEFLTKNPLFPSERKIERTGIGIDNTVKRLEHLYPNQHKLQISRENGWFIVRLSLYSV